MIRGPLLTLLFLLLFAAPPAAPGQDPYETPYRGDGSLADIFAHTAFGGDFGGREALYRFEPPWRIGVVGGRADLVAAFAAELAEAAGRDYELLVQNRGEIRGNAGEEIGEPANILVGFVDRAGLDAFVARGGFPPGTLEDCGIVRTAAWIMIAVLESLPEAELRQCVAQEMTNAVGLSGDLDGRTDTVLAPGGAVSLTGLDRRLLAILYDPRLRHGMSRVEAMPVVERIVAERGW